MFMAEGPILLFDGIILPPRRAEAAGHRAQRLSRPAALPRPPLGLVLIAASTVADWKESGFRLAHQRRVDDVHVVPGRLVTFMQFVVCATGPSPAWAETRRRSGEDEPREVPRRGSGART
jgi:hypothetical protein